MFSRIPTLTGSLVLAALGAAGCTQNLASPSKHLLIVLDGLRPDYVTPDVMPTLHALGSRGVVFENHHAVYPTVTRVNASSISTGAYPERHGLMGNSVFFPAVDPARFLDTSDRSNLIKIQAATNGQLLTAPTLGETLELAGRRMLVVSAGSAGSSFLLNHTIAGGAVIHHESTLPESLDSAVRAVLGDPPPEGTSSDALNERAVDAFLRIGIPTVDPSVTVLWLTDPDSTAHDHGLGDPVTVESLRAVDRQIRRLEEGLREAGLLDTYNIWVTSDHGFSTHTGAADLQAVVKPLGGTLADGSPTIVTGAGAIYVRSGNRDLVTEVAGRLQRMPGVGALFTQAADAGSMDGWVPGTLSFDVARWGHERAADILFSADWTDALNPHGVRGTTASGGVAGHGSTSPFDIHNPLMAAGPDLKQGVVISAASGNVDFAPTFLHLLAVTRPDPMQGRVLIEALRSGPAPEVVPTFSENHTVATRDGAYRLTAFFTIVESGGQRYRYLDRTEVVRTPAVVTSP